MFKDIQIIDKTETIGWKFEYNGKQYGNCISDQVPTGETYTYWDDEEECEKIGKYYKTVPLTEEDQIALLKNMIDTMEKLTGKK